MYSLNNECKEKYENISWHQTRINDKNNILSFTTNGKK